MTIARLLVVDDDAEMREMLTEYLRASGFFVNAAATGAERDLHRPVCCNGRWYGCR